MCDSQTADTQDSIETIEKAAQENDAVAQYRLGKMYLWGDGVEQDYHNAVELLEKSAHQNFVPAEQGLGCAYFFAYVAAKDSSKLIEFLKKSAQYDFTNAKFLLGMIQRNDNSYEEMKKNFLMKFNKFTLFQDSDYTQKLKHYAKNSLCQHLT